MTFDEPNTTDDVIKSCEDADGKVKLPTTVDEVITSADKEFLLGTVDTGVEVLLCNTADEVCKFHNDVEGNVLLSADIDELVMPTVELCSPDDPLADGSELCMEGVKEVALETGFEVDNKATCVKDEKVFAVVL